MRKILAVFLALACLSASALAAGEVVATASVNLRSGPGLDYAVVTAFSAGARLEYLGEASTDARGVVWYRVRWTGGEGWVSSRYAALEVDSAPPQGDAVELSACYRQDLKATAAALGLTDYAYVESEVPNRYSDGALTLAGWDTVDCIIISGPGYALEGVCAGMDADAALGAMLDAGLRLYAGDADGFAVEYPGENPFFLGIGDFGGIIYVTARDGAVTGVDLESYTG